MLLLIDDEAYTDALQTMLPTNEHASEAKATTVALVCATVCNPCCRRIQEVVLMGADLE